MVREDRETFSSYGKDVFMNHDEEFHDEKKDSSDANGQLICSLSIRSV